ncbi:hypothetical protein DP129_01405 [Clostridium tetani]|uniref:hypothetical protein n=1 Tax=Clostridium tetani TaxID=1513 RepID=UPI0010270CD2|nr:hypothetical protein [Clostridium tetani]RXI41380.1 hypothetical protein DP129_01405 [Clostridium tetani]
MKSKRLSSILMCSLDLRKILKIFFQLLFRLTPIFFIILLYFLNLLIFKKYPTFIGCLCGTGIYFNNIYKINTFKKLRDNILDNKENKLLTKDFFNIVLTFILTFLFIGLVYGLMSILGNVDDLGIIFWATSFIFQFMNWIKVPKRFFY